MSITKDGLLLAAGGLTGLFLASLLESEEKTYAYDENDDCNRRKTPKVNGMEILLDKVRRDAEWSMEECITDEEREKVYAEVKASISKLQSTLQKRGNKIIADLKEQSLVNSNSEELDDDAGAIISFKSSMEDLTKSLDETLKDLKLKASHST